MAKKTKEPSAYPRVDNSQTFSTLRLIPAINQKNYYTNYLKKDSQYLCRKSRDRPENSAQHACIFHVGSENLRVGLSTQLEPKVLPFCVGKPTREDEMAVEEENSFNQPLSEEESVGLAEAEQSFVDRMKFYKTRIVPNAQNTCRDFNMRQKGEPAGESTATEEAEGVTGTTYSGTCPKYYCVDAKTRLPSGHKLYWPLRRGKLNEDFEFYKSAQELEADIHDILYYATYSTRGIDLNSHIAKIKAELDTEEGTGNNQIENKGEDKGAHPSGSERGTEFTDAVLVVPDLFDRSALQLFVRSLFGIGFKYVAIIEEAVAATYGAGISAGCVVDIGAQTTTVACVEDGLCIADSRVHLDFGSSDMTRVFGKLLARISFPGEPDFATLDALKKQYFTVNEVDINVQLYRYYTRNLKFDFKVYNEVMLPVLGLFYPQLFGERVTAQKFKNRYELFPQQLDAYTGHIAGVPSDADINVRMQTLFILGSSYQEVVKSTGKPPKEEVEDGGLMEDDDESRLSTPASAGVPAQSGTDTTLTQLEAYETLDPASPACVALDHAIIESIAQAQKHSGTEKLYYENILVVGGGSKIPSFHTMLSDRLTMWNQSRIKDIGDVAVMAIPQGADAESICWRGGSVYSKLKIVDEMWTSSDEWDVLGSRTLHYKAALYAY